MDKGNYRRAIRLAWRSRWVCYLEWFYIAYIVLQISF